MASASRTPGKVLNAKDVLTIIVTGSGVPEPGPKAGTQDPTPIAPTSDIPSKEPGSEKQ